jgi:hypothetical protein
MKSNGVKPKYNSKGVIMGAQGTKSNHKKGIAAAAKARRREEALARQVQYDKLSLNDKIARAKHGSREHTRLVDRQIKGA